MRYMVAPSFFTYTVFIFYFLFLKKLNSYRLISMFSESAFCVILLVCFSFGRALGRGGDYV